MENKKFPCVCGHRYDEHEWIAWNGVCWVDKYDFDGMKISCPCQDYKPDNLKYLEQQHDKKMAQ